MVIAILISLAALTLVAVVMMLVMSSREGSKTIPPKYESPITRSGSRSNERINGEDD